jgi:hypothetical protein
MKSIAALTILVGSAVAFAPPTPVSRRVESSLNIASELSSMPGISTETGGKVVCDVITLLKNHLSFNTN